jgi:hypothetical protein
MSSQQDHATINDKNAYHNRYKLPIRHSSLHILQKESNSQKCHRIPLTEATLLSTNTQAFFPPRIASRLKEWWARALLACRSPHDDLLNILVIIILVSIAVLNIFLPKIYFPKSTPRSLRHGFDAGRRRKALECIRKGILEG